METTCSPDRRCRRRDCDHCGPQRHRDERRKFLENIRAHGRVILVSITGPGKDVLPMMHGRVLDSYAYGWNLTASDRYARLWKAATLAADRQLRRQGYRGPLPRRVANVWSPQSRGIWHVHEAFPGETAIEIAWSRAVVRFIDAVRRREERIPAEERWAMLELERHFGQPTRGFYGFGYVDRNPLRAVAADAVYANEHTAAAYLARNAAGYLAGNAAEAMYLPGRTMRSYVARRLTMLTGVTMRNLRRLAYLYVCLRDSLPLPNWSEEELDHLFSLLILPPTQPRGP